MGKKTKEQVISQEEYFARLEQGVPVGDCRIDMGNGELAYALYEVVVVGVPFNKYADKFFEMLEVNVCVANMNLPGPKNGANHTGGGIQTIVSSKEVIGITTIVK